MFMLCDILNRCSMKNLVGTGKTATFAIALMQRINFDIKETQGLVLAPTRELAQQIQKVVVALGDYLDVSVKFILPHPKIKI